jgi:hypothetical protein
VVSGTIARSSRGQKRRITMAFWVEEVGIGSFQEMGFAYAAVPGAQRARST